MTEAPATFLADVERFEQKAANSSGMARALLMSQLAVLFAELGEYEKSRHYIALAKDGASVNPDMPQGREAMYNALLAEVSLSKVRKAF